MADGNGQAAGAASRAGNDSLDATQTVTNIAGSNPNLPGTSASSAAVSVAGASGTANGGGGSNGTGSSNQGYYQLSVTSEYTTNFRKVRNLIY